ncbi:Anaerobic nitric oxide reductase transcription regulator NorR [Xanthomonas hydrangeae]|nr:Anaerobic nitric oxide reductase transcription regulator NorR [Xanthomonas hydrangeae]CAD7720627.1 Anaerobic nitric oxide reductase transcription regulator NorR [Xanthomonas hydrangeae]CAD7729672.1 Anaerobic nitric oxide reductase transcription regulator NorR [Xanthomonas hydrangeae]CAD7729676.1 Anaerobic nitric oxide reductase transcription regulator NorR [Xanthomonas hydrangeae]
MEKQVLDIVQRAYLPGDPLARMLRNIAAKLSQSEIANGASCEFVAVEYGASPTPDPAEMHATRAQQVPVRHGQQVLGALRVTPGQDGITAPAMLLYRQIATCCAYLAKRDAARALAQGRFGRALSLVGVSEAVWKIDEFVAQAAYSRLPVILRGEFGTEKEHVAVLLHAAAPWQEGPFIAVDCAAPADVPAAWFERAAGGTLFLQGVDELGDTLQRQLAAQLLGGYGPWFTSGSEASPRVIASTTADLSRHVRAGHFSRALRSQLDVLSIKLAPLRKRQADIGFHVECVLDRHGLDHRQLLTEVLMDALTHYSWPDNLQELERLVLRLAVMTDGRPIGIADIQRHAPHLLEGRGQGAQSEARATMPQQAELPIEALPPEAPADWIDGLPHRPGQRLASLHDALRRALVHLGEHYAEPLTLGDLARQAHVSQSHLGFLFRDELGTPFKPMLQQLRIEKAKELLQQQRKLRITEVALKVGFGDLSHFEKSFRRLVGVSPREFRQISPPGALS